MWLRESLPICFFREHFRNTPGFILKIFCNYIPYFETTPPTTGSKIWINRLLDRLLVITTGVHQFCVVCALWMVRSLVLFGGIDLNIFQLTPAVQRNYIHMAICGSSMIRLPVKYSYVRFLLKNSFNTKIRLNMFEPNCSLWRISFQLSIP